MTILARRRRLRKRYLFPPSVIRTTGAPHPGLEKQSGKRNARRQMPSERIQNRFIPNRFELHRNLAECYIALPNDATHRPKVIHDLFLLRIPTE